MRSMCNTGMEIYNVCAMELPSLHTSRQSSSRQSLLSSKCVKVSSTSEAPANCKLDVVISFLPAEGHNAVEFITG